MLWAVGYNFRQLALGLWRVTQMCKVSYRRGITRIPIYARTLTLVLSHGVYIWCSRSPPLQV